MERHREAEDTLAAELDALLNWSSEHGLEVVSGWIQPNDHATTITWAHGDPASWRTFLTQAKALGAAFVVNHVLRLEREEYEGWLEEAQERKDAEWLSELSQCEGHIGHVVRIALACCSPSYPGVVLAWSFSAPWCESLDQRGEAEAESAEGQLDDAQKERLAAEVAADPEFQRIQGTAPLGKEAGEIVRKLQPGNITDREISDVLMRAVIKAHELLEDSPELRELGARLSQEQAFQRAKNTQQKTYAAEKFLPAEVMGDRAKLEIVLNWATTIYEVDHRKGRSPQH